VRVARIRLEDLRSDALRAGACLRVTQAQLAVLIVTHCHQFVCSSNESKVAMPARNPSDLRYWQRGNWTWDVYAGTSLRHAQLPVCVVAARKRTCNTMRLSPCASDNHLGQSIAAAVSSCSAFSIERTL